MTDPLRPGALLCAGTAALVAYPTALLVAVCGQALGAVAGGCQWIGLSLSPHRPAWALLNQPTLDFASRSSALGYWLGSSIAPLVVAVVIAALLPRPRWLSAEILLVQLSWVVAVIGGAWLPLLDPDSSHLALGLKLWRAPAELLWLAPITTAMVVLVPTLRLLALLCAGRPHAGRLVRMATVVVYFGLPLTGWWSLVAALRGDPPVTAMIASGAPLVVATIVAWYGQPKIWFRGLDQVSWRAVGVNAVSAIVLWGGVFAAGQPLGAERAVGVIWMTPTSFNNIRDFIEAVPIGDRLRRMMHFPDAKSVVRSATEDCPPGAAGYTMMTRPPFALGRSRYQIRQGDQTC